MAGIAKKLMPSLLLKEESKHVSCFACAMIAWRGNSSELLKKYTVASLGSKRADGNKIEIGLIYRWRELADELRGNGLEGW